jgi:hypothetical protein
MPAGGALLLPVAWKLLQHDADVANKFDQATTFWLRCTARRHRYRCLHGSRQRACDCRSVARPPDVVTTDPLISVLWVAWGSTVIFKLIKRFPIISYAEARDCMDRRARNNQRRVSCRLVRCTSLAGVCAASRIGDGDVRRGMATATLKRPRNLSLNPRPRKSRDLGRGFSRLQVTQVQSASWRQKRNFTNAEGPCSFRSRFAL